MSAPRIGRYTRIDDEPSYDVEESDAATGAEDAANDETGVEQVTYHATRPLIVRQVRKKPRQRSRAQTLPLRRRQAPAGSDSEIGDARDTPIHTGSGHNGSGQGNGGDGDDEQARPRNAIADRSGPALTVIATAPGCTSGDGAAVPYLAALRQAIATAHANGRPRPDSQALVESAVAMLDYLEAHPEVPPAAAFRQFILQATSTDHGASPSFCTGTLEDVVNAVKARSTSRNTQTNECSERRKHWNLLMPVLVLSAQGVDSIARKSIRASITRLPAGA